MFCEKVFLVVFLFLEKGTGNAIHNIRGGTQEMISDRNGSCWS